MKGVAAAAVLAAAGLAFAAPASAEDVDVSFNIGAVSDYVFRGFSQTDEEPAIQGGVDITTESGLYAGLWASNVDFYDSTDAEVDAYIGYRTEAAGFAWDVGLIGYGYVNDPNGSGYNYAEAKLAASRAVGPATIGAAVYYSPNFFGKADDEAVYYELNGAFTPFDKLTISGAVGQQKLDVSDDYTAWNLGASYALFGPVSLDVRYHGSDVDGPLSDDRVVGGIKAVF
ncbi:MAG: hypothetical protein EON88_12310 [Brevundimonas sp.]|nr:MAG: hypothetical protein EON88_12310 [Brevundimonas sp.]